MISYYFLFKVIALTLIMFTPNFGLNDEGRLENPFTPISIGTGLNPHVTLCRLRWDLYWKTPSKYASFKNLVSVSLCHKQIDEFGHRIVKSGQLSVLLNELDEDVKANTSRCLQPNGFIFHESRVGSTLVSNLLGSDRHTMVFSESSPPSMALMRCRGCSREANIKLFRDVIRLMGRTYTGSNSQTRLFFKFQSVTTTRMDLALEAFPTVPWAFIFRNPLETAMSQLDSKKIQPIRTAGIVTTSRGMTPAPLAQLLILILECDNYTVCLYVRETSDKSFSCTEVLC